MQSSMGLNIKLSKYSDSVRVSCFENQGPIIEIMHVSKNTNRHVCEYGPIDCHMQKKIITSIFVFKSTFKKSHLSVNANLESQRHTVLVVCLMK